ncbi:hypothetical protein DID76_02220 [Candidatus Marinamargulisbacteria bacterium SCGC AG-414-C22]|nr:hypothetical protein DID76_02220 [Candidatus Marinamargulisbacteria bacterium SCGC AG-414-C22]
MIIKTEDYNVDCTDPKKALLIGSMRLPSPLSYENIFDPIKECLEKSTTEYAINIKDLNYMNSSGLTALARLLIMARTLKRPITIYANDNIPWQRKSLVSLEKLWDQIKIQY